MLPEGITPGPWDDSKDKGGTAAAFQRVTLGGAVEFHGKTEPAKDPCWVFHHQLELNTVWRGPNSKKRGDHYLKNPENDYITIPSSQLGHGPRIAAFEQLADPSLRHTHDQRLAPKPTAATAPAPGAGPPRAAARRPREEPRRAKTGRKKTNKDVEKTTGVLANKVQECYMMLQYGLCYNVAGWNSNILDNLGCVDWVSWVRFRVGVLYI